MLAFFPETGADLERKILISSLNIFLLSLIASDSRGGLSVEGRTGARPDTERLGPISALTKHGPNNRPRRRAHRGHHGVDNQQHSLAAGSPTDNSTNGSLLQHESIPAKFSF